VKNLRQAKDFVWDEEKAMIVGDNMLWETYLEVMFSSSYVVILTRGTI
jgi:hypothetical protein